MAADAGGKGTDVKQCILRISDLTKEPLQMLMPISGYEEMPIVSLEKAVEPLIPFLPIIQSYAYAAKQRCPNPPPDGLTIDESASIMLYSMGWEPVDKCLYVALNATLRSEDRQTLKPWFLYLKLFLTALSRLPSTPRHVYRGVKLDLTAQYPIDKAIVWWGFSSCTTSINVLQSELFLGKTGTRTMFTLDCHSGKDIQKHSYYTSENEILLLAATQFKVVGCLDVGNGFYTIQLKEVQPSYPLLHPISHSPVSDKSISNVETNRKSTIVESLVKLATGYTNDDLNDITDNSRVTTNETAKSDINTYKKSGSVAGIITQTLDGIQNAAGEKLQKTEHTITGPITNLLHKDTNIIVAGSIKSVTKLRNKIGNLLSTTKESHKSISLSSPPTYTNKKLQQFIKRNKSKSLVLLSQQNLTSEDMEIVGYYLIQDNTTLTELFLEEDKISDEGAQYISNALQFNTTLTYLHLGGNQIGDKGVEYLSNALQINKTLTELYLSNNQIGVEGAQYLSNTLQMNTTLITLNLDNNQIGTEGTQYLSNALQFNKTLTHLHLTGNQIGDEGVQYLVDALQLNRTLTHLYLSNNQIGDEGIQYLSNVLQINKTVIGLYLDNNEIHDKGRQLLEKLKKTNQSLRLLF